MKSGKFPSSGHLGISERWPLALAAPQALGLIVQQHGGCHVPGTSDEHNWLVDGMTSLQLRSQSRNILLMAEIRLTS